MNPVIFEILDILIAGTIILAFLGLLAAGIIGCFLLLTSSLKRYLNLRRFRAGLEEDTGRKNGN